MLDTELTDFVQTGVAIVAATRDAANVPALTRGGGCRVSVDGCQITIYVATIQAGRCLDNVRATGAIAAVFTGVADYVSYQLKGRDARVTPIYEEDHDRIRAYRKAVFEQFLAVLGVPEAVAAGVLPKSPEDFAGLTFTPTEIFRQTPGPGAGNRYDT